MKFWLNLKEESRKIKYLLREVLIKLNKIKRNVKIIFLNKLYLIIKNKKTERRNFPPMNSYLPRQ